MIGFFSDPYPDELLYSACARYTSKTSYLNKQAANIELFGKRGISAIIDFPTRLDHFISVLPEGHNYSVKRLIDENTLLPFYQPFLPVERADIVREEMGQKTDNRIHSRLATRIKQIEPLTHLRYCSICVVIDREKYGETYWHRVHQLPGIPVCPNHKCFLKNSSIKLGRMSSKYFQEADSLIKKKHYKPKKLNLDKNDHKILHKLALDAQWLLSQSNLSTGGEIIRKRYFNTLLRKGLCYYNGRMKQKDFIQKTQKLFSPELFKTIGRISDKKTWLVVLLQSGNVNKTYHPIRHLLMMAFLETSAKELLTNFDEFKPFVNPPYPCLNRASEHYKELRIQNCEIQDNISKEKNKQGLPLGVFKCDCGFTYQRIGPDSSDEDKFKYNFVREYGKVWETRLAEYWKDLSISGAQIGKLTGISSTSVGRHAIRLDLPMNTETTRSLEGYKRHRNPNRSFSQMKKDYRKDWLKVRKANPNLNRKQLSLTSIFLYLWLRKNDAEWIENNLPKRKTARKKRDRLNWKKIDKTLSRDIKIVCQEISSSNEFPVRICISEIVKRIGHKSWIDKRVSKLPLTTQIVNQNIETFEDYMIRKIKWAKNYFISKKKIPARNRFNVKAVVRNKTSFESLKIQKAIDDALNEIEKSMNP